MKLLALPLLLMSWSFAVDGGTLERAEPTSRYEAREVFRVTAYCDYGITRSGALTRPGIVSVDPRVIPLGSKVWIEGFDTPFDALDTGGGVKGRWVDMYLPTYQEAIQFGMQYRRVDWETP